LANVRSDIQQQIDNLVGVTGYSGNNGGFFPIVCETQNGYDISQANGYNFSFGNAVKYQTGVYIGCDCVLRSIGITSSDGTIK
jgi:hypothetical protein